MKRTPLVHETLAIIMLALAATFGWQLSAAPLGTAFTFQGKLTDGGPSANGSYDLKFTLFDTNSGGVAVAVPITNSAAVSNGLFTATLDFGVSVFTGEARWLEIATRTNGAGAFATFPTRQLLTPAPYALWAQNAGVAAVGAVSASSLNTLGAPAPGQVLTYNGTQLTWMSLSSTGAAWSTTGNSGTAAGANFLGTTDTSALELKVNNQRALALVPNTNGAPNVIGGHAMNRVSAGVSAATIAGGGGATSPHLVSSDGGTVSGGYENQALGLVATVSGGQANVAGGRGASVGGGLANTIATNADFAFLGGGRENTCSGWYSVVPGGWANTVEGDSSFLGGGKKNGIQAGGQFSVLGGGFSNSVAAIYSFLGGGVSNYTAFYAGAIGGGEGNRTLDQYATVGGGRANLASGPYTVVGGGTGNLIEAGANYATIGGGEDNTASGVWATVSGGYFNRATNNNATVAGGWANTASGLGSFVGGGGFQSGFGEGVGNTASGKMSAVSGGGGNNATALYTTIGGGGGNSATNSGATVPGGMGNVAGGKLSFAAGSQARALHDGSFVWADASGYDSASLGTNVFQVRATGGIYVFFTPNQGTAGPYCYANATSGGWVCPSDRNLKENVSPVDPRQVLERLTQVPVARWNMKGVGEPVPHIGPMAQDFQAAFGVGEDDKHIATVHADGVALAAIQGLNEIVRDQEARIEALERQNAALKGQARSLESRLATLEKLVAAWASSEPVATSTTLLSTAR